MQQLATSHKSHAARRRPLHSAVPTRLQSAVPLVTDCSGVPCRHPDSEVRMVCVPTLLFRCDPQLRLPPALCGVPCPHPETEVRKSTYTLKMYSAQLFPLTQQARLHCHTCIRHRGVRKDDRIKATGKQKVWTRRYLHHQEAWNSSKMDEQPAEQQARQSSSARATFL